MQNIIQKKIALNFLTFPVYVYVKHKLNDGVVYTPEVRFQHTSSGVYVCVCVYARVCESDWWSKDASVRLEALKPVWWRAEGFPEHGKYIYIGIT